MPENETVARVLRLVGLAAKAGRVVAGSALICTALQKARGAARPALVLLATDASANTRKRLTDRTAYYDVPLRMPAVDCERLALSVGKRDGTLAAVGITEPHLAAALLALLPAEIN